MASALAGLSSAQLANIPLAPPPVGRVSHLDNPGVDGDTRPTVVAVKTVLTVLLLIFMGMRLYCRRIVTKSFAHDDVAAVVATILALAGYFSSTAALYYGAGPVEYVHSWDISLLNQINATQFWFTLEWTYFIYAFASKLALTTLYMRIFGPKPEIRVAIWLTTVWAFLGLLVGIIGIFAICRTYDKYLLLLRLKDTLPIIVTTAAMNLVTDLMLLAIPVYAVCDLHMSRNRKLAVGSVFATGLLAVLASTLSLYYRVRDLKATDPSWDYTAVSILTYFEIVATIIVSCMPAIPALMQIGTKSGGSSSWSQRWLGSSIFRRSRSSREAGTDESSQYIVMKTNTRQTVKSIDRIDSNSDSSLEQGRVKQPSADELAEEPQHRGSPVSRCMICAEPTLRSFDLVTDAGLVMCPICYHERLPARPPQSL